MILKAWINHGNDQFSEIDNSMPDPSILINLQTENARLIALLEAHGIEWRIPPKPEAVTPPSPLEMTPSNLSTDEKVLLFRRLFRGRDDVYPIRWESQKTGKSGYAPACANECRLRL